MSIFSESYGATLQKKMDLRDRLKRDFGLEVEISDGYVVVEGKK